MSKWISLSQGLPSHGDRVLAISKNYLYSVCVFLEKDKVIQDLKNAGIKPSKEPPEHMTAFDFCSQEIPGNVLRNVTHWMILPELPR
jgi:hypothetical protein